MATVHPSSAVDSKAHLGEGVEVGPFCHVGPGVVIGPGTRLVSHVTVLGRTTLGAENVVWPQATLGADPQDLKFHGEETRLIIGDHNQIRESVTIHLGTENGGGVTRIGNDNLLMVGAHVAHDCEIGDHVVLANAVHLAGHIRVEDHVVVSGASAVHHYVTIGQFAFIGGMTRIVHDAAPFMIHEGNPAKVRGVNLIGLTRHQFPREEIDRLKEAYRRIFRAVSEGGPRTVLDGASKLGADYPEDECIQLLVAFVRNSSAGLYGRHREGARKDSRRRAVLTESAQQTVGG